MQLAIYEYEIRYKKGKENIIADALSRLLSENEIDPNNDEDYLDILIATINDDMDRFSEREENEHESSLDNNANIIASQPSSTITNLYECSLEE